MNIFLTFLLVAINFSHLHAQSVKELKNSSISFVTSQGAQSWGVGEARFSISKVGEGYCMNLWLSSNDKRLTPQLDPEMDDSYGPNIECSVWLKEIPKELVGVEFKIPNYSDEYADDYGYDYFASNNMYFYEHHTMKDITINILKEVRDNVYQLQWSSKNENVFNWELPMMKVEAILEIELSDTLKGYWVE